VFEQQDLPRVIKNQRRDPNDEFAVPRPKDVTAQFLWDGQHPPQPVKPFLHQIIVPWEA
jgi:hypothetical protein